MKETKKKKIVLITGASGFVGGYLRQEFVDNGYEVIGTDLKSGNAEYIMDVTKYNEVFDVIQKVQPDMIVHLAGFASVKASFDNADLCHMVNVEGTKNVIDSVIDLNLKTKILIISSSEVYDCDLKGELLTESSSRKARSPYGRSRIGQEAIIKDYVNVNWIISRSFPHIGPKQQKGFVTADFASQIADLNKSKKTEKIMTVGNLDAVRDFTDVRDTVRAYRLLLEKGKVREIYNVCSGEGHKISEILEMLLSFSEVNITVKQDPERMRPSEIPSSIGNYQKLKRDTGWTPKYTLNETLKDIYDFWSK